MKAPSKDKLRAELHIAHAALDELRKRLADQINKENKELQQLRGDIRRLTADNDKMRQQVRDYQGAIIGLIDHYTAEINRMTEPEVNNNEW